MTRRVPPIIILFIGLIFGIVGYNFFYKQSIGIGIVLFLTVLLAVILILAILNRLNLSVRKLWLVVPILFFAAMLAARANVELLFFDGLMMIGLIVLFSHYLTRTETIDEASTPDLLISGLQGGIGTAFGAIPTLGDTWKWVKKGNWRAFGGMKSVLRGIALAVPIVIVFAVLLSSADMVFAERVQSVFDFLLPDNIESLLETGVIVGGITWLCTGLISNSLIPRLGIANQNPDEAEEPVNDDVPKKQKPALFSLNLTETSIVLSSVAILFATFVMIQFTYLFGGRTVIGDFTFSEYARRGFFELVAVSVLIQGLILIMDNSTIRRSQVQNTVFRALSIVLIAETFVILASAWRRMSLYEIEYGFTHLRVYTHIFMIWLGILLFFTILDLLRIKKNVFSLGLLIVAIGYLGTLNILNVDNYIAGRNIERFHDGHELDLCYFRELSPDALPAITRLYEETTDTDVLYNLEYILSQWQRRGNTRYTSYTAWIEFNYSHHRAHQYFQELETIILNTDDWQGCYINRE